MSTPFARAARKASAALDRVFGERFRVHPRRRKGGNVNAGFEDDPDRGQFEFVGAFVSVDEDLHAENRRLSDKTMRATTAPTPAIDFSTAGLQYLPRKGDLVRRLEDLAWFEVGKRLDEDDQVGRAVLQLIPVSLT